MTCLSVVWHAPPVIWPASGPFKGEMQVRRLTFPIARQMLARRLTCTPALLTRPLTCTPVRQKFAKRQTSRKMLAKHLTWAHVRKMFARHVTCTPVRKMHASPLPCSLTRPLLVNRLSWTPTPVMQEWKKFNLNFCKIHACQSFDLHSCNHARCMLA